jgi:transcription antitermination protein NusB
MGKRTKARECALQMLYQWDITRDPMDRVAGLFWQVRTSTDETRAMAERLARGAQKDVERLDQEITRSSKNWRFDRIAAIDKNILRLAVYELLREPETPSSVVIDEAVELAKRFSEVDSPPFVNGVLDAIKARVRGEPAGEAGASRGRPRAKKEKGRTHE